MTQWNTDPIFGSYAAVILLAVVAITAMFLIRLDRHLSFGKRFTLSLLRLLAVVVLLLVVLRPGVTWTGSQSSRQSVAVLVDTSASMQLPSGIGSDTRWEIERQVLSRLQKQSESLGEEVEWKVYGYDSQMRSIAETSDEATSRPPAWVDSFPKVPQGALTDVGQPFNKVLSSQTEPPLMAIVWLGDGAQTGRGDTSDAQQAARQYAQLDIPMYLIGVGPRSGAEETRDQIVEGVPDQSEAFAKNRVAVRGNLRALGLQGRELTVGVFLRTSDGQLERLEQVKLKPSQLDQTLPFDLPIVAPAPGAYQLLVKAEAVDGEATLLNNEQTCFLNVRDSGSRVLILEGQPRTEQKFVRMALADSLDLQVDWRWFPETNRKKWPIDLGESLQADVYDCLILGDLDAEALGDKNIERIVELVEKGIGLITLGGYHAYSAGGYEKTALAGLLPMELDKSDKQYFEQPMNDRGHWPGEISLIPRDSHPILELASPDERSDTAKNANLSWNELRPLLGANKWKKIKADSGARILAAGPNNEPLIVTSEFGRGRVLCLAFDSSYRWWLQGKSELHRRFWRQAVLWTMRREEIQEGFRLTMPKRSMALGESASYNLAWNPGSKSAPMPKAIEIRWSLDGEDRGPLLPNRINDLLMTGEFSQLTKPGRYEISVSAQDSQGRPIDAKLPFVVVDMAVEKLQSSPDWQLINQLAKLNESAGGKIVAPESTDEIIKSLHERRKAFHVESVKTIRLGENLADSWIAFLCLVVLFSIQWSLRKAWNLP